MERKLHVTSRLVVEEFYSATFEDKDIQNLINHYHMENVTVDDFYEVLNDDADSFLVSIYDFHQCEDGEWRHGGRIVDFKEFITDQLYTLAYEGDWCDRDVVDYQNDEIYITLE